VLNYKGGVGIISPLIGLRVTLVLCKVRVIGRAAPWLWLKTVKPIPLSLGILIKKRIQATGY